MSDYKEYTVLDGTNPTLDASDLSYEFEKARIRGVSDERLESFYFREENKIMPENFQYLSSFRDPETGTSGVAFRDKPSEKTIIAYTGTNPNSDLVNDANKTDAVSIAFGTGHHLNHCLVA
jgi:lipase class 3 (fragment)